MAQAKKRTRNPVSLVQLARELRCHPAEVMARVRNAEPVNQVVWTRYSGATVTFDRNEVGSALGLRS